MPLSANTLFHFVSKFQYLTDILEGSIFPRYCLERFNFINNRRLKDIAIPMVCFCDIPLSQITNHIEKYGKFAIGMNKQWAQNQHITPVQYIADNANIITVINNAIQNEKKRLNIIRNYRITENEFHQIVRSISNQIAYMKPVKGKMWRRDSRSGQMILNPSRGNIIFYDEREWRFVPDISATYDETELSFINKDTFEDSDKNTALNKVAKTFPLNYKIDDIKFIIMPKQFISQFQTFINSSSFLNDQSEREQYLLKTITVEQIKEDL